MLQIVYHFEEVFANYFLQHICNRAWCVHGIVVNVLNEDDEQKYTEVFEKMTLEKGSR